jgi:4-hydroxy-tetrahydrodipicolinate reductase
MINGLPGNAATEVARLAHGNEDFEVIPASLTGPEITQDETFINTLKIRLIRPEERDAVLAELIAEHSAFICVDYTHPSAVNDNAGFYCRCQLPFVMGTTGGDRLQLHETVRRSTVAAVIAPNMAKPIVGLQAMMAYAADNFPGLFSGYRLDITESHQAGKADTSGTAKAMVAYFNRLGVPFAADEIIKVRDPLEQHERLGVPEAHLKGHGWHTYRLTSADDTVTMGFMHNVNGRRVYAIGTLDAVRYLSGRIAEGESGVVYDMIDVLKGF